MTVLFIVLPLAAFLLIWRSFQIRLPGRSWREAFLATAITVGVLVVLVTEGLSLLRAVNEAAIIGFWILAVVGAALFLGALLKKEPQPVAMAEEKLTWVSRLLLGGVAGHVVATAVIAFLAPPNTWDSMEYHLPKVMHWIQNQSAAFYPTAIPRQNHLTPGAEFVILHLQLLSGSDRFANFAEWFSMLGSLVAVSLIARQLGAKLSGQILAVAFVVSLPMGIMQASSTQTDYVVAFWFAGFVYYLLEVVRADMFRWPAFLALSAALGLAGLSKGTTYLFAPGFLLWLVCSQVKTRRARALISFGTLAAIYLVLNLGPFGRNWEQYRNPLGPGQEPTPNSKYSMDTHEPKALFSNWLKHLSTHINTPWKPFNKTIKQRFDDLHTWMGFDLNDPRTSFAVPAVKFSIQKTNLQDESDGNPIHFLLGLVCGGLLLVCRKLRTDRLLRNYTLALLTGGFLFAFLLKWHPWMSRLHLGLFVLLGPFVAVVLARLAWDKFVAILAGGLLLLGLPWLLFCQERPMLGKNNIFTTPREQLYFNTPHQKYALPFANGRDFLRARQLSAIGLVTGNSSWEYPWWVMLPENGLPVRLEHVNVTDPSSRLYSQKPFSDFRPEAVIALDQKPTAQTITVTGTIYVKKWEEGPVAIYQINPVALGTGKVSLLPNAADPSSRRGEQPPSIGPKPGAPWENSLGMKFVPVPGTNVLFCIWETRVQDFEAFVKATGHDAGKGWRDPAASQSYAAGFSQTPLHPVVNVSWNDAVAFCRWLTEKEQAAGKLSAGQEFRLPTAAEWSLAVGLPADVYPWGTGYPPPAGSGNYSSEGDGWYTNNPVKIEGYTDGARFTAKVGSYTANRLGIYDMGGNVWEWCGDWFNAEQKNRMIRGASFNQSTPGILRSSVQGGKPPGICEFNLGFRCVVTVGVPSP